MAYCNAKYGYFLLYNDGFKASYHILIAFLSFYYYLLVANSFLLKARKLLVKSSRAFRHLLNPCCFHLKAQSSAAAGRCDRGFEVLQLFRLCSAPKCRKYIPFLRKLSSFVAKAQQLQESDSAAAATSYISARGPDRNTFMPGASRKKYLRR